MWLERGEEEAMWDAREACWTLGSTKGVGVFGVGRMLGHVASVVWAVEAEA